MMSCDEHKPVNEEMAAYWSIKDAEMDRAYMSKVDILKCELHDFMTWYADNCSCFDDVSICDLIDVYINQIKNLYISIA